MDLEKRGVPLDEEGLLKFVDLDDAVFDSVAEIDYLRKRQKEILRKQAEEVKPRWASELKNSIDTLADLVEKDPRLFKAAKPDKYSEEEEKEGFYSIFTREELELFRTAKNAKKPENKLPSMQPDKYPKEEEKATVTFKPRENEGKGSFVERVMRESGASRRQAEGLWDKKGGTIEVKIIGPKATGEPPERPKTDEDEESEKAEPEEKPYEKKPYKETKVKDYPGVYIPAFMQASSLKKIPEKKPKRFEVPRDDKGRKK